MRNNTLQNVVLGITMMAGISLSACDGKNQTVGEMAADSTEQSATSEPLKARTTANADLDGATVGQGTPVNYDLSTWSKDSVEALTIHDFDKIKATFGKVLSTDENSLDYASNPAIKYRFMATDALYIDLID